MRARLALAVLALVLAGCGSDSTPARTAEKPSTTTTTVDTAAHPIVGDHVHLAYGIYLCDHWLEPLMDLDEDRTGIHTHGDGLIHVHPFSGEVAGERAVLGRFADDVGMVLEDGAITLPNGTRLADGGDCGNGTTGTVRAVVWQDGNDPDPQIVTHDLASIPARRDGGVIALVFAPEGTSIELPRWAANLEEPTRSEEGKQPLVA